MKSLLKLLSFSLAVLFMMPAPVLASPADPTMSSVDEVMVGNASGNPLKPAGTFATSTTGTGFVVVVRHITGSPIAGTTVTIDFTTASGATGVGNAINPYNAQQAPTTVDCPSRMLTQVTDGSGVATFVGLFGGAENGASIMVRARGVPLKLIKARSTDLDANGTTGLNDFNLFRQNFLFNTAAEETDYSGGGGTTLVDFNIFRVEFLSGAVGIPCV